MGGEKQKEKHHGTDQKDPPVKGQKKPHRCGNSLAPLKFQIKREIMSEDTSGSCIKFQKTYIVSKTSAEDQPCDEHGQYTFQDISQKRQGSRLFPHGPEGIGSSRIPAAVFPDIDSLFSSINVGRLE